MSKGVIDLRKQISAHGPVAGDVRVLGEERNASGLDLEWSAYEHEYRIRGQYWFLYPLVVATAGMVFGILTHNYLFVAFVFISLIILTYYARKKPQMIMYRITSQGVWAEQKLMSFEKLKSFWIFKHPLMVSELLLETEHPISPIFHIRLENVNADIVRNMMSRYLPEKEQKDLASDQIARMIGL